MPKHTVKLKDRREVAAGTMAFQFDKPQDFAFKSGQFLEVTLTDPQETDAEGDTRAFSIASAPSDERLMVATRLRDTAFKRVLKTLPLGTEVIIDGAFGNLILHSNAARPAVLLAGGIGITPFRSMVFRAAAEKLPHRIFLFYSNREPQDAPFLEELQALQKQNPNYTLIATLTAAGQASWQGETGHISREMLAKHVGELIGPVYYAAGPPAMVAAMQKLLNGAGISDDDIRAEEFAGY